MESPTFRVLRMVEIHAPSHPARLSMDPEALGRLADDIAANGLLQPIGCAGPDSGGHYEIGFGHRRWMAHTLLRRETIEAKVWPVGTPLDDIRSAENYQREPLSAIEEAHDVARRLDRGESRAAIARVLRRSPAWVAARETLLHLPDELQEAVHAGDLSIGVAVQLAEIDHEPYRRQLILEAQQNGASVATARVWAAHYAADKPRIIANGMAVQEIVEARRAFVAYYPCDGCGVDAVFTATRAMRFCPGCAQAISQAMSDEKAASSPA